MPPRPAADAVRRGQPFLPRLRKERQLQAAGARLRPGNDVARISSTFFPDRPVDASHPDVLLDFNRCILCELCVRASRDVDGKNVFALAGRGRRLASRRQRRAGKLGDTDFATDRQGGAGLPGGRDPAQGRRLRQPIGERLLRPRRRSARSTLPGSAKEQRNEFFAPAKKDQGRHRRLARRLLRLPHVAARHRRAPVRSAGTGRIRPLAAHRHQALRPAATSA